jgi:hypothetical protein
VPGPDDPSSVPEVGATARDVADDPALGVPCSLGLAEELADAVALGVADAVAFVEAVGFAGAGVAPGPDFWVPEDVPDPDVVPDGFVAAGFEVGLGAAVVGLGLAVVGAGLLVAVGAGGAMPGWPPEPNLKPTTVPGAGL